MSRGPWQISLGTLFAIVTLSAILLAFYRPERPPPPLVPTTERERQILSLAERFVQPRAPDYAVPIAIAPAKSDGVFQVTYWTPHKELELLGPRAVLVDTESRTVEFIMRD